MRIYKKIISIALVFMLAFTGLPIQFMNFDEVSHVYAAESTSTVDISYENFANTENLQLNGDALIVNNAIQFESGSTGESVFTTDMVDLGDNLSFSTTFSFRNISPSQPGFYKKGGFTFTLQSVGNTVAANAFQDQSIQPSLSIAFAANYYENRVARVIENNTRLLLASLTGFRIAEELLSPVPPGCYISASP